MYSKKNSCKPYLIWREKDPFLKKENQVKIAEKKARLILYSFNFIYPKSRILLRSWIHKMCLIWVRWRKFINANIERHNRSGDENDLLIRLQTSQYDLWLVVSYVTRTSYRITNNTFRLFDQWLWFRILLPWCSMTIYQPYSVNWQG